MNETPQELDANIMKAEALSSEAALPTSRREELYPGDTGALPFDVRRLLITLLRGPYLDRSDDKRLWRVLIENADLVRSRLADLLLDLLIDEGTGIAFCRKAELGELQAPSLLPTVRLKFLDSALLLELRERLVRAAESGERAVVTLSELRDLLRVYDRASLSNDAALEKHLSGIVERLKRRRILLPLKVGDSFEVSRVLALLFTSADIESLAESFREKAHCAALAATVEPETSVPRKRRRRTSSSESAHEAEESHDAEESLFGESAPSDPTEDEGLFE